MRDPVDEPSLVEPARQWVIAMYPYNSHHLIESLNWLERIVSGPAQCVRLAALTHDMERAFPGPDQPVMKSLVDPEYHQAHSARSARIVGAWLRDHGATEPLACSVEELIRVHEDGGWPEANLVQAADSLSFLDCNIDLFLGWVLHGKWPAAEVKRKFDYTYDRIQSPLAKDLALPMLETANARLALLEREMKLKSVPASCQTAH